MVSFLGFGSASESSSAVSSRSSSPLSAHLAEKPINPLNPDNLKPCCACPETKAVRDECFFRSAPEVAGEACREMVEAHKACMRSYGFKV